MGEVFVVDAINPRPGQAHAVRALYLDEYAPGARERGMELRHSWIAPPVMLTGNQRNRLTFVWSVEGTQGWWRMRRGAMEDPLAIAFWEKIEPLIEWRERTFHGDSADV